MTSRSIKILEAPASTAVATAEDAPISFIETVLGPDKGRVVELFGQRLSIGRSDENDIVVPNEGISRTHAFLMKSDGAWFIRDNNSKNGIQVNGQKVTEAWLSNGDVVQVGNFVFRFREPTPPPPAEESFMATPAMGGTEAGFELTGATVVKKKPNRRLLLYGVVGIILAFALMSGNEEQKEAGEGGEAAQEAQTEKLARDFEAAKAPQLLDENGKPKAGVAGLEDPALKAAEQEMAKLDWTNSTLREAEQFFRKGQRDFLSGNYQRAIDSFQTALSFYRGHRLAEKYLRLAVFEVETQAKKHMEMGLQYFESLQYQRAMYHFGEVINLMQHRPQEAIVGEAERYISLSRRRLQAAELFP